MCNRRRPRAHLLAAALLAASVMELTAFPLLVLSPLQVTELCDEPPRETEREFVCLCLCPYQILCWRALIESHTPPEHVAAKPAFAVVLSAHTTWCCCDGAGKRAPNRAPCKCGCIRPRLTGRAVAADCTLT